MRFRALLAAVLLCGASPVLAQTASGPIDGVFWPQLDLFYQVARNARLYGIATYTFGPDPLVDNAQYGLNVDLFWKHRAVVKHRPAVDALAFDRSQPIMLRMGYRYATDLGIPGPSRQNRVLFELTGRLTKGVFTLAERNSFDFRWTDGKYSTRYRNRLWAEAVVSLGTYQPVPYANAEWFYSVQNAEWTKVRYEAGVHFPVASLFAVEPYAAWEDYWDGSPDQRGVGLTVVLSW